eukprot:TRINITY_DN13320_c0_g1_i4.p1 TRINITY_DN13320_c0_g1~~TRINITY_DN13320_c0_g1_i4.p1  ORF type:complete len:124 (-),score=67.85 TRINITY_DN13320_c0_g1_i4:173-544(-)
MKEVQERNSAAEADRLRKLQNQYDTKNKEYSKFLKFQAPPADFFRGDAAMAAKYGQFDTVTGLPAVDAEGAPLAEKALAKLKKEQDKYAATYDDLAKKEKETGKYSTLKAEMDAIQVALKGSN